MAVRTEAAPVQQSRCHQNMVAPMERLLSDASDLTEVLTSYIAQLKLSVNHPLLDK